MTGNLTLEGTPDPLTIPAGAASGLVLTSDAQGNATWQASGSGVTLDTSAGDIQPLGSQAAGSTGKAADAGHVHPTTNVIDGVTVSGTPASGKVITATSSTAATWQAPAVIDGVTVSGTPVAGNVITATSGTAANWQTPAAGVTLDGTAGDLQGLGTAAAGSVGKAADSGHVHPATIQGVAISNTAPTSGQVLTATSGSAASWQTPSGGGGGVTLDTTASDIAALGTQAAGSTGKAADAGHVHPMTGMTQVFNVMAPPYNATGNAVQVSDGAMTASSATLACTTSTPFTSAAAGRTVVVQGAGASGADLVTTISSYTDTGHVTLAASASTTVSATVVTFGSDDTSACNAAMSAVIAAQGGSLYFPPGGYLTTASIAGVNVHNGVQVFGEGLASCIFPTGSYDALSLTTGTGLTIRDLQVNSALSAPTAGGAWSINSIADYRLLNVSSYGTYYGLYTTGGTSKTANAVNCYIQGYAFGAYIQGSHTSVGCHYGGGAIGMILDSGSGHSVRLTRVGLYGPLSLTTRNSASGSTPNKTLWFQHVECNYQTGLGSGATALFQGTEGPGGMNLDWSGGDVHITSCWLAGTGLTIGGNTTPTWVEITGGVFSGNSSTMQNAIILKSGKEITITGAHLTGSANHTLYDDILINSSVTGPVSITGCEFSGNSNYNINSAATSGPLVFAGNSYAGYSASVPVNYPSGSASQYTIAGSGNVNLLPGSLTVAQLGSNLTGGGMISMGSGAPSKPNGLNPTAGDVWLRTDTPTVANQRYYCCTVGGSSPTWVGLM